MRVEDKVSMLIKKNEFQHVVKTIIGHGEIGNTNLTCGYEIICHGRIKKVSTTCSSCNKRIRGGCFANSPLFKSDTRLEMFQDTKNQASLDHKTINHSCYY